MEDSVAYVSKQKANMPRIQGMINLHSLREKWSVGRKYVGTRWGLSADLSGAGSRKPVGANRLSMKQTKFRLQMETGSSSLDYLICYIYMPQTWHRTIAKAFKCNYTEARYRVKQQRMSIGTASCLGEVSSILEMKSAYQTCMLQLRSHPVCVEWPVHCHLAKWSYLRSLNWIPFHRKSSNLLFARPDILLTKLKRNGNMSKPLCTTVETTKVGQIFP